MAEFLETTHKQTHKQTTLMTAKQPLNINFDPLKTTRNNQSVKQNNTQGNVSNIYIREHKFELSKNKIRQLKV